MKATLKFIAILVLGVATMTPAYAESGSGALDEKGRHLKSMLAEIIETYKNSTAGMDAQIMFDGDITVEQAADYYAVTLPYLYVKYADGARFDVGLIAINAAPHSVEGQWKMTFALPTPMSYAGGDGKEALQITIGGQRSSGVWTENLDYFSKLDANFQDIAIQYDAKGPSIAIPAARIVYDLDTDENGKWSGPTYFSLNDIVVSNLDTKGSGVKIGAFDTNLEMFQYDPNALEEYRSTLQSILADHSAGKDNISTQTPALYSALVKLLGNGFTSEFQLTDVSIINNNREQSFKALDFNNARFGFDLTGFLDNQLTLGLRAGFDGLKTNPEPTENPALFPADMNIDLALEKIPFNELTELAINTFNVKQAGGEFSNLAAVSMMFNLPVLLSKAQTTLVLQDNYIANDLYRMDLGGKVISDAQAAHAATADLTTKIKGLDDLLGTITTEIQANPNSPNSGFLRQIQLSATMLKGFAKTDKDDNGDILHVLNFVVNKAGQILVNNNDMSILFGGLPGGTNSVGNNNAGMPQTQAVPPAPTPETETLELED